MRRVRFRWRDFAGSVLSSRDRRQRQINNAEYVSVADMKLEIEISGVLQFRLVLHTSGTVPSTATSS
jgi:hypothetical protein